MADRCAAICGVERQYLYDNEFDEVVRRARPPHGTDIDVSGVSAFHPATNFLEEGKSKRESANDDANYDSHGNN